MDERVACQGTSNPIGFDARIVTQPLPQLTVDAQGEVVCVVRRFPVPVTVPDKAVPDDEIVVGICSYT